MIQCVYVCGVLNGCVERNSERRKEDGEKKEQRKIRRFEVNSPTASQAKEKLIRITAAQNASIGKDEGQI